MAERRGVIWDFDGTLAERPGLWSGCLLEVIQAENPNDPIQKKDISVLMGTGFPWHSPEVSHPELSTPDAWWGMMTELLTGVLRTLGYQDKLANKMAAQVRGRYLDDTVGWRLYPDTYESLQRIADAGLPQVILSNHTPELADLVKRLGLSRYFRSVITSALTGYEKPHKLAYESARVALPNASKLWMIGDSVEADAIGPAVHGIETVLLWRKPGCPSKSVARYVPDLAAAAELVLASDAL